MMIAIVKTIHIAALVLWCAGLLALPLLLGLHRWIAHNRADHAVQHRYTRFRVMTHWTYTALTTPCAVVAIAAGTVLIFAAQVYEVWLLAKLACVAGMVLAHAWLGHLIVQSSEKPVDWRMPWPPLALLVAVPCMLGVLALVLFKPDLTAMASALPAWLQQPLELDVVQWLPAKMQPQEALP